MEFTFGMFSFYKDFLFLLSLKAAPSSRCRGTASAPRAAPDWSVRLRWSDGNCDEVKMIKLQCGCELWPCSLPAPAVVIGTDW